eukprot:8190739-Alexandrium_andersonii.AAC.1
MECALALKAGGDEAAKELMQGLRGGVTQSLDGNSDCQPSEAEAEEDRKAWACLRRDAVTGRASHSWEGA